MSRIFSLLILIGLSPILLIISIAIGLNSGYPVLFRQKRVGKNNTHFLIYKFRTMKKDTPDIASHLVRDGTSFYTSIGPFLRKFSLDELPQLFNILKGNMVFIGPRPALYNQNDLVILRTKAGIDSLTPGVTGWAQVNGRDELSISDKVKMDEFYLNNKSIWLDIKILFMTFSKVLKAEGVSR
tara:strand:+ start:1491 stop:2039 length:549 start_codon:yes stop_codon:yes gene_type:complete